MTQDEIIRMALEADIDANAEGLTQALERFTALVSEQRTKELMQLFLDPENQPTQFGTATLEYREAEVLAEREACAKLMDDMAAQDRFTNYYKVAANAIRARGEK